MKLLPLFLISSLVIAALLGVASFFYIEVAYEEEEEEPPLQQQPVYEDECYYDEGMNETVCMSASMEDLEEYLPTDLEEPPSWLRFTSWGGTLFSSTGGIALGVAKWTKALKKDKSEPLTFRRVG